MNGEKGTTSSHARNGAASTWRQREEFWEPLLWGAWNVSSYARHNQVKNNNENGSPSRQVAVVVPVVRLPLSVDEEISLRHLREHLRRFDRYIIGLQSLTKEFCDFRTRPFPNRYFSDRFGYNRLLLTEEFYRAFEEYEYILIYQLDCLVFADNLEEWCGKGWDYVGAPWLVDTEDPTRGFSLVGNGGLSLRRVQRALEVLRSRQFLEAPKIRGMQTGPRSKVVSEALHRSARLKRMFIAGKTLLHRWGYHNNARWLARDAANSHRHEDHFWAYDARKVVKEFRIPEPREALEFSFELAPRYCFTMNGGRLPFGCHAWFRYDREFWEPFLLK
jgi:Protein of unknown function (DUF5672)